MRFLQCILSRLRTRTEESQPVRPVEISPLEDLPVSNRLGRFVLSQTPQAPVSQDLAEVPFSWTSSSLQPVDIPHLAPSASSGHLETSQIVQELSVFCRRYASDIAQQEVL